MNNWKAHHTQHKGKEDLRMSESGERARRDARGAGAETTRRAGRANSGHVPGCHGCFRDDSWTWRATTSAAAPPQGYRLVPGHSALSSSASKTMGFAIFGRIRRSPSRYPRELTFWMRFAPACRAQEKRLEVRKTRPNTRGARRKCRPLLAERELPCPRPPTHGPVHMCCDRIHLRPDAHAHPAAIYHKGARQSCAAGARAARG